MLAAGTGIAPMMQVIRHIVHNEGEDTFVRLLYACRTYKDVLLREELNQLTAFWNFTVLYVLSQVRLFNTPTFNNIPQHIEHALLPTPTKKLTCRM